MKKLIITALCLVFGFTNYAQTEDKMEKTVTTKTTVKNNKGEEVAVQKRTVKAQEELAVENNNETNQAVRRKKAQMTSSTSFMVDQNSYMISPDGKGYVVHKIKGDKRSEYGVIRKMPEKDIYVLHTKEYDATGYFDNDGNFVVGNYNQTTDNITLKKYMVQKPTR